MMTVIVDDSRAMRMIVTRMLRRAGFDDATCHQAGSGREAFSLIRRTEPDLVLSDWHMPEGGGLELLTKLRAIGNTVTFGFITADATPQMQQVAAAAGADFLVAKPFTAEALRDAITAAMP